MRHLAPAGGFPSPLKVVQSLFKGDAPARLLAELSSFYSGASISLFGSGKSAIETLCEDLRKGGAKRLVTAGYGCPDVVAAALRGGLKVHLIDVNERTLEPNVPGLDSESDVLLLTNLYGLVDSVDELSGLQIIDDACQAALSYDGPRRLGSRGLGVVSFGRGKAFCGAGGGAAIGLKVRSSIGENKVLPLLQLTAFRFLEHPELYGIPASLPFLNLGDTRFDADYADTPLSEGQAAIALEAVRGAEADRVIRLRVQGLWGDALQPFDLVFPKNERSSTSQSILTRFPILVSGGHARRDQLVARLKEAGTGASISYPAPLSVFCSEHLGVSFDSLAGAKKISESIITLPTHRYVTEEDIGRTADIFRRYA